MHLAFSSASPSLYLSLTVLYHLSLYFIIHVPIFCKLIFILAPCYPNSCFCTVLNLLFNIRSLEIFVPSYLSMWLKLPLLHTEQILCSLFLPNPSTLQTPAFHHTISLLDSPLRGFIYFFLAWQLFTEHLYSVCDLSFSPFGSHILPFYINIPSPYFIPIS
jgi:hypothetical protein